MQARARRLERKMEEDQVRRTLRYLTKYISKVETRERESHNPHLRPRVSWVARDTFVSHRV